MLIMYVPRTPMMREDPEKVLRIPFNPSQQTGRKGAADTGQLGMKVTRGLNSHGSVQAHFNALRRSRPLK
jgi:hypothetical protein